MLTHAARPAHQLGEAVVVKPSDRVKKSQWVRKGQRRQRGSGEPGNRGRLLRRSEAPRPLPSPLHGLPLIRAAGNAAARDFLPSRGRLAPGASLQRVRPFWRAGARHRRAPPARAATPHALGRATAAHHSRIVPTPATTTTRPHAARERSGGPILAVAARARCLRRLLRLQRLEKDY
jgi:hypothetical protein